MVFLSFQGAVELLNSDDHKARPAGALEAALSLFFSSFWPYSALAVFLFLQVLLPSADGGFLVPYRSG